MILVLLPGRDEADLPTELKATAQWVRVPALTDDGTEHLLRQLTGQPAFPKPPVGERKTLPPRAPAGLFGEAASASRSRTESAEAEVRRKIDRADTALDNLPCRRPGRALRRWTRRGRPSKPGAGR